MDAEVMRNRSPVGALCARQYVARPVQPDTMASKPVTPNHIAAKKTMNQGEEGSGWTDMEEMAECAA